MPSESGGALEEGVKKPRRTAREREAGGEPPGENEDSV
jgi:hypothetical protein